MNSLHLKDAGRPAPGDRVPASPLASMKLKALAALAVLVLVLLVGGGIVLDHSWREAERESCANYLRTLWRGWTAIGAPATLDLAKYADHTYGTTTLDTASQVIEGRQTQGLFAFRLPGRTYTYVVNRDGQVFVRHDAGRVEIVLR